MVRRVIVVPCLIVALCLIVVLSVISYAYIQLGREITVVEPGYFNIPAGSSLNAVTNELSRLGVIPTPAWLFKFYARITQSQGDIVAGEYQLLATYNSLSLLRTLRTGNVVRRNITFPEGWRFSDWQAALNANKFIDHQMDGLSDALLAKRIGISFGASSGVNTGVSASTLEGQFFPDTYQHLRGESDLSILRRAHQKMRVVLQQQWASRSTTPLRSPQELLIMASIIEKETGFGPDRGNVASVFINRLQKNMKLQSDPTVIYGAVDYQGDLTRRHLRQDTPYNTYTRRGLPLSPICNPGLASIRAAIHPPSSDYYYFVARGDGRSAFSRTLGEHIQAVNQYQRNTRLENYQSAPGK
ncbi:MAG: endolytic transglycosylase MltG [Pseudomonadales bacterium]|nr:endolytic transglycosylase MltG [Pseudomonadales bacterium]